MHAPPRQGREVEEGEATFPNFIFHSLPWNLKLPRERNILRVVSLDKLFLRLS